MDPKIYMCYYIYAHHGDNYFKMLLYHWKKENKGIRANDIIRQIDKNIKIYRRKYSRTEQGRNWRNLDSNKFIKFIDEKFNWSRKG